MLFVKIIELYYIQLVIFLTIFVIMETLISNESKPSSTLKIFTLIFSVMLILALGYYVVTIL